MRPARVRTAPERAAAHRACTGVSQTGRERLAGMNSIRHSLTAAVIMVLVSVQGVGAASGAEHPSHAVPAGPLKAIAAPSATSPPSGAALRLRFHARPPGPATPEGFPQEFHREERLLEDEHEHQQAAPHTLARFGSGSD